MPRVPVFNHLVPQPLRLGRPAQGRNVTTRNPELETDTQADTYANTQALDIV
jgi:hypothetical protein